MGYYGPIAVIGLLRQLAVKRADDHQFLERLASAAVLCGQAQLGRKISLTNQSQLGFNFLTAACSNYFAPQAEMPDRFDQPRFDSTAFSPSDRQSVERILLAALERAELVGDERGKRRLTQWLQEVRAMNSAASASQDNPLVSALQPTSNVASQDGAGDFKWPAEIGDAADDKFPPFGAEFDDTLGREDGQQVARLLFGFMFQDEQVWFYDRVWRYFSAIPLEQWPKEESNNAELWCRRAIGFFQAFRSQSVTCARGWIPVDKRGWYLDWLLRLLGGEPELQRSIYKGKLAAEFWLPLYEGNPQEPWVVLSSSMASFLEPRGQGILPAELTYLVALFAPTLDTRVEATTALAFGDEPLAQEKRKDAVRAERALALAVEQLATGGGVCHILETDQGLLISNTPDRGIVFYIWTEERGAQVANSTRLRGTHRVASMDYRELEHQLTRMMPRGLRYVDVNNTLNERPNLVPAEQFLARLRQSIATVDDSPLVKMLRTGIDDLKKTHSHTDA
jgi:hypothetical protein